MIGMVCSKCGASLTRAMLLALLQDAGAQVNPRPDECPKGGEHDFIEPKPGATP